MRGVVVVVANVRARKSHMQISEQLIYVNTQVFAAVVVAAAAASESQTGTSQISLRPQPNNNLTGNGESVKCFACMPKMANPSLI